MMGRRGEDEGKTRKNAGETRGKEERRGRRGKTREKTKERQEKDIYTI